MLFVAPELSAYTKKDPLKIAGVLIFAYGWGVLIVEKFWEGLKGSHDDNAPHGAPGKEKD